MHADPAASLGGVLTFCKCDLDEIGNNDHALARTDRVTDLLRDTRTDSRLCGLHCAGLYRRPVTHKSSRHGAIRVRTNAAIHGSVGLQSGNGECISRPDVVLITRFVGDDGDTHCPRLSGAFSGHHHIRRYAENEATRIFKTGVFDELDGRSRVIIFDDYRTGSFRLGMLSAARLHNFGILEIRHLHGIRQYFRGGVRGWICGELCALVKNDRMRTWYHGDGRTPEHEQGEDDKDEYRNSNSDPHPEP